MKQSLPPTQLTRRADDTVSETVGPVDDPLLAIVVLIWANPLSESPCRSNSAFDAEHRSSSWRVLLVDGWSSSSRHSATIVANMAPLTQ